MRKYLKYKYFKIALRRLIYFILGNAIGRFYYDKKYLTGKHFEGHLFGALAIGWEWVFIDMLGRKMNREVRWPVSPKISVVGPENIYFHPDDLNNFQGSGNYFQGIGNIYIGQGTYIAMNVGIITSNHTIGNLDLHDKPESVTIGKKCWIGMNSVILPGVTLGDNTVVGAGAVVSKSYPEGNCIIAGNPAKIIRYVNER